MFSYRKKCDELEREIIGLKFEIKLKDMLIEKQNKLISEQNSDLNTILKKDREFLSKIKEHVNIIDKKIES